MARVIVSAGHTQNEPGAVVDGLREVDFTRKIAKKVTSKLREKGIITLSVPPELELPARIKWINDTGYREETEDICLEIHINDGGKSGIEGWFKGTDKGKSYNLVNLIVKETCKATNLTNQGVKSETEHPLKTLAFLSETNPTSALLECLYIDNPKDQQFLKDETRLDSLAAGIVKGILRFFDVDEQQVPTIAVPSYKGRAMQANVPKASWGGTPAYTPRPVTPTPVSPYPSYQPPFARPQKGATPLTREQKKEMIRKKYKQILGRKVNDQDLSYFANMGLSEDQMMKRIIESQEHADLVKDAQEYRKIKDKHQNLQVENRELKVQLQDKEKIIQQQNALIAQKNKAIQELQNTSAREPQVSTSKFQEQNQPAQISSIGYQEVEPPKETLFDKILKKLNDIFD